MEKKQPFWNELLLKEQTPEPKKYEHHELECLIGQYAVVLATIELAPDWRKLYEDRRVELQEQLEQNKEGMLWINHS